MKIAVIGDAMLDVYRKGTERGKSPEDATCPRLVGENRWTGLGGAANVAKWLAKGTRHDVTLFCHWGASYPMETDFIEACDSAEIELQSILFRRSMFPTISVKERIIASNKEGERVVARFDKDAQLIPNETEYMRLRSAFASDGYDLFVIADYDKGLFHGTYGEKLVQIIRGMENVLSLDSGRIPATVVNSKVPRRWRDCRVDFLVYNQHEGIAAWPGSYTNEHPKSTKASFHIVTRAEAGAEINGGARTYVIRPSPVSDLVDVIGAGDAFTAGAAIEFATQNTSPNNLTKSQLAAIIDVGQRWAAECCGQLGCGSPESIYDTPMQERKAP